VSNILKAAIRRQARLVQSLLRLATISPKRAALILWKNGWPSIDLAWTVEDTGAAFVVKDGGGQNLAYPYYEEEAGRRSAAKLLTKDEPRRIGAKVAGLPELLSKSEN
jgi:hypothetical protein